MILRVLSALVIVGLTVGLYIQNDGLKRENEKLRDAFSAVVARERGSCQMDPGTRVVCGLSADGRDLSRLELAEDDQIVSGKAMRAPIGKKKRRKVAQ